MFAYIVVTATAAAVAVVVAGGGGGGGGVVLVLFFPPFFSLFVYCLFVSFLFSHVYQFSLQPAVLAPFQQLLK